MPGQVGIGDIEEPNLAVSLSQIGYIWTSIPFLVVVHNQKPIRYKTKFREQSSINMKLSR